MRALLVIAALVFAAPATAAELQPFVRGTWQELRDSHAGKPVVVHMWGLTCAPCLVEMPLWGKLLHDTPGLALVMIAADPAPQEPEHLAETLNGAGLGAADNWVFADDFGDRLRYEIDPRWRGELPRTLLIAANGEITALSGVADMNAVAAWIAAQKE